MNERKTKKKNTRLLSNINTFRYISFGAFTPASLIVPYVSALIVSAHSLPFTIAGLLSV